MQQSRKDLLDIDERLDLTAIISIPEWVGEGIYRCRISYSEEIEKIEFFAYQFRHPRVIELVEDLTVLYQYKFEDRSQFQRLLLENPEADDVIVTHNGYLTDATFANLAFFDGKHWLTPHTPLLNGTKRQYLMNKNVLKETPIRIEDLQQFKQMALINAMRDLTIVYDFTFQDNHLLIHGNY
jgi:4-amino-4-deoxychorismate lyase